MRSKTPGLEVPGFSLIGDHTFESAGQTCTVAIYRCEIFAQALGLARNSRDVAAEFVLVPGGQLDEDEEACPQPWRRATVGPFLLGRTRVTQGVWDFVAKLCGLELEDERRWCGANLPIHGVSWSDIQPFLYATRLRLPSAAEWVFACTGGPGPRHKYVSEEERAIEQYIRNYVQYCREEVRYRWNEELEMAQDEEDLSEEDEEKTQEDAEEEALEEVHQDYADRVASGQCMLRAAGDPTAYVNALGLLDMYGWQGAEWCQDEDDEEIEDHRILRGGLWHYWAEECPDELLTAEDTVWEHRSAEVTSRFDGWCFRPAVSIP